MTCLPTTLLLGYALHQGPGGLLAGDPLEQWTWGQATVAGFTGPMWGTGLRGQYLNDATHTLLVPLPDLSGTARPVVVLDHHWALGSGDRGVVDVQVGGVFTQIEPIHGYPGGLGFTGVASGFTEVGFDLSEQPGATALRLRLEADAVGSGPGWHLRQARVVDGDPMPPQVQHLSSPVDTQDLLGPYEVVVGVEEDVALTRAVVRWQAGLDEGEVPLSPTGAVYRAGIPAMPPGTDVHWWVEAADCASTVTAPGPGFRVFLAAPTGLAGPSAPHTVTRFVTLTWEPPDSPHPVVGYLVRELGTDAAYVATDTMANVAVHPDSQDFVVQAAYDAGMGDPSDVLALQVEVPELLEVQPAVGLPGDRVYVELIGSSLYLIDGVSALNLGAGIEVETLEVRDVGRAVARIAVQPDATSGPRAVTVSGAQGTFSFQGAFQVGDPADTPRVIDVQPTSLTQGDSRQFTVRASHPFAGPVQVTTTGDLISSGEAQVDGEQLTLQLAAVGTSRVGQHTVVLDDGARLWSLQVQVREHRVGYRQGCAAVGAPAWLGLLALSVARRRSGSRRPGQSPAARR